MRPAILAAGMLNFVRALESFDTPAIIALPARNRRSRIKPQDRP